MKRRFNPARLRRTMHLWLLAGLLLGLASISNAGESVEEIEYSEKYGEPISPAQVAVIESWRTDDPSWWQDPAVVATARDLSAQIYQHYYEAADDEDFVARVDGDPELFGVEAQIRFSEPDSAEQGFSTPAVAERIEVEFLPALRPDLFVWSELLIERVMDFAAIEGTLVEDELDQVKTVSGSRHLEVAEAIGLASWDTAEESTLAFYQAFKAGFRDQKQVLQQNMEALLAQLTEERIASDSGLTALDLFAEHVQTRAYVDAFADQVCAFALGEISGPATENVVRKLTRALLVDTVEFRLLFPPVETRDRVVADRNAVLQSLGSDS